MNEARLLDLFKEKKALLEGHFLLSSGLHSDRYFQSALLLQYPEIAAELGRLIAGSSPGRWSGGFSGPRRTDHRPGSGPGEEVPGDIYRAENGQMTLRRGFRISPREKILLIEDVITTGVRRKK